MLIIMAKLMLGQSYLIDRSIAVHLCAKKAYSKCCVANFRSDFANATNDSAMDEISLALSVVSMLSLDSSDC